MKGTEHFKDVIQNYLETRASYDELFAENFRKESKNIDECITYILTESRSTEKDYRTTPSRRIPQTYS